MKSDKQSVHVHKGLLDRARGEPQRSTSFIPSLSTQQTIQEHKHPLTPASAPSIFQAPPHSHKHSLAPPSVPSLLQASLTPSRLTLTPASTHPFSPCDHACLVEQTRQPLVSQATKTVDGQSRLTLCEYLKGNNSV